MRNSGYISQNFTSRIQLLTNEVEKLSDALVNKGNEYVGLQQINQRLAQENIQLRNECSRRENDYFTLAELLKDRTIEYEELGSQYNRLKNITLKEQDKQILDLQLQNDQLKNQLGQNDYELLSAKDNFIAKVNEMQDLQQSIFRLESALKQMKEEKLRYIVEYQQKDKENESLKKEIENLEQFKVRYQNALVDIELIRSNYSSLFMQKEQDKQVYNEQLNVQREVANNNVEIVHQKFVSLVESERNTLRKEYESKMQSVVVQLENHVTTLQNLLSAKEQENDRQKVQTENMIQRMRQEYTRDIQAREQNILELNISNQNLLDSLHSTIQQLQHMENHVQRGNILNRQESIQLQNTIMDLTEMVHAYELRCRELKIQNDTILKQFQEGGQLGNSRDRDETAKKSPNRRTDIDNEEKIKYLLSVIEKQNLQLRARDNLKGTFSSVSSHHMD